MMKTTTLLMALALAWPAANLLAQDNDQPRPPRGPQFQQRDGEFDGPRDGGPRERRERLDGERPRGPRPGGPAPDVPKPPLPPLIGALDANHDGVIDETEINNAAAALKKLDKNGDGKLTMEELRPPRPQLSQGEDGPQPPRPPRGPQFRGGDRPDGPPQDGPRRRAPRPPQDNQ